MKTKRDETFARLTRASDEARIRYLLRKRDEHAAACQARGCVECKDNEVLLRYSRGRMRLGLDPRKLALGPKQDAVKAAFARFEKATDEARLKFLAEQRDEHAAVCKARVCLQCKDNEVLLRYYRRELKR